MTDAIYDSVYSSLGRAIIHTSTYSENSLAMRAGLATLDVLETEQLGESAERMGAYLRFRLSDVLRPFEMVGEIRGLGLFSGIEFKAPKQLTLRIPFEAVQKIHPAVFGQALVGQLIREKRILTQICGNNFMVLKVAPPLLLEQAQADEFIRAIREVVEYMHSSANFLSEAWTLARRAMSV